MKAQFFAGVSSANLAGDLFPQGCNPQWFTAEVTSPSRVDLAPGVTTTATVKLTLNESGSDQSACEGYHPTVVLSAIG